MRDFCNQSGRAVAEQISPTLPARAAASVIFDMWTALSSQGVLQYFDQIARVHISGLFVRSHMNAGQDGLCDKSSKQNRDLIEGHWNMRTSLVVDRLITPSARYLASSGISSTRLQLSLLPVSG